MCVLLAVSSASDCLVGFTCACTCEFKPCPSPCSLPDCLSNLCVQATLPVCLVCLNCLFTLLDFWMWWCLSSWSWWPHGHRIRCATRQNGPVIDQPVVQPNRHWMLKCPQEPALMFLLLHFEILCFSEFVRGKKHWKCSKLLSVSFSLWNFGASRVSHLKTTENIISALVQVQIY